jgi:hypothetical protein
MLYSPFLAEIADALGRDGKAAEGLSIIDEALAGSERSEERWYVAELLRIKAELILREGAPQAATAAEEHLLQSLDWARRQGALSWELRTSTSLARLQQDQGRIFEAVPILALEIESAGWQAKSFVRDTQAYPRDEHCQSSVGSASDPWRTPQARRRYRTDQRGQVHGQATRPAVPRLEDIPPQSR